MWVRLPPRAQIVKKTVKSFLFVPWRRTAGGVGKPRLVSRGGDLFRTVGSEGVARLVLASSEILPLRAHFPSYLFYLGLV